jgi:general transcription factor 3C polypeptide 5 (transcription factor C subunit 1)
MDIDPTLEPEPELEPEPGPSTSRATAPQHPLPSTQLYSVEYPGYVKDTSTPRAIANLGGYPTLGHAFRRAMKKQECVVEVKVRPEDPFAHPIPGDIVGTSNVVLRVVKRRRKRAEREGGGLVGEYKMEALGSIRKTVRFRSERLRPPLPARAHRQWRRHG